MRRLDTRHRALASALALLGLLGVGCDRDPVPSSPGAGRRESAAGRASDEAALGWRTYRRYCSGCHGDAGDGKGPAAAFLFPPPRDFTRGLYKFTTTPSGSLPTDEDLLRTIAYGLRGTAMPAFHLISGAEKQALLSTLKAFYKDWSTAAPSSPVTRHSNPFDMDPAFPEERQQALALGEEIYHGKATCWNCHPLYISGERLRAATTKYGMPFGREKPGESLLKEDAWGQMIPPPDFKTAALKSVRSLDDLYRAIAAGVGGTAMPTWVESLTQQELWGLTLYVDALIREGAAERRARLAARR
jgi:cytochrome c oxidase cbb3-type subunit 2